MHATDTDPAAPTLHVADNAYLAPSVRDVGYIPFLSEIVRKEKIGLVVPLIDPELPILADGKNVLRDAGAIVMVSGPDFIRVAED